MGGAYSCSALVLPGRGECELVYWLSALLIWGCGNYTEMVQMSIAERGMDKHR